MPKFAMVSCEIDPTGRRVAVIGESTPVPDVYITPAVESDGPDGLRYDGAWTLTDAPTGRNIDPYGQGRWRPNQLRGIASHLATELDHRGLDWTQVPTKGEAQKPYRDAVIAAYRTA